MIALAHTPIKTALIISVVILQYSLRCRCRKLTVIILEGVCLCCMFMIVVVRMAAMDGCDLPIVL